MVGVTLNSEWATPKDSTNVLDVEAADRRLQFLLGWSVLCFDVVDICFQTEMTALCELISIFHSTVQ